MHLSASDYSGKDPLIVIQETENAVRLAKLFASGATFRFQCWCLPSILMVLVSATLSGLKRTLLFNAKNEVSGVITQSDIVRFVHNQSVLIRPDLSFLAIVHR